MATLSISSFQGKFDYMHDFTESTGLGPMVGKVMPSAKMFTANFPEPPDGGSFLSIWVAPV